VIRVSEDEGEEERTLSLAGPEIALWHQILASIGVVADAGIIGTYIDLIIPLPVLDLYLTLE
jgi:hypothetical protein